MKVGLLIRISRSSSRSLDEGGSTCSLEDGRPSLPNEIFVIFDRNLFFFLPALLSNVLLALLKLSSVLNVFSSTKLALDLFIKSSANETLGLGSRLIGGREEVIEERSGLEFCLVKIWFE